MSAPEADPQAQQQAAPGDNGQKAKARSPKPKKRRSDAAVDYLLEHVALFRNEDTAYVQFPHHGHVETGRVTSKRFKVWVRTTLRKAGHGRGMAANQLQEVLQSIEDEALTGGAEAVVFLRVGKDAHGNILIDPGWPAWERIVVTPRGWKVLPAAMTQVTIMTQESPTIKTALFVRPEGFGQLPQLDDRPGDLLRLRRFVNLGTASEFRLLLAYVVHCFLVDGPFLILVVIAEQGSAKSVTFRVVKRAVDPHAVELLAPPKEPRDVYAATAACWLNFWDNLSTVPDWLSDCWCRLVNGAGTLEREYYTNGEPYFYHAKRPIGGNGITDILHRGDALQRSLILQPPRIPKRRRIPESTFWAAWDQAAPVIFRGLLDTLVGVLAELPDVHLGEHLRQADFCRIGTALERTLGWAPSSFMAAYERNQGLANQAVLEASCIAPVLQRYIDTHKQFIGTASELKTALEGFDGEAARNRYWPRTPKGLSDGIRRLAPNLREVGLRVEFHRTGERREIAIFKGEESCVILRHASPAPQQQADLPGLESGDHAGAEHQDDPGLDPYWKDHPVEGGPDDVPLF